MALVWAKAPAADAAGGAGSDGGRLDVARGALPSSAAWPSLRTCERIHRVLAIQPMVVPAPFDKSAAARMVHLQCVMTRTLAFVAIAASTNGVLQAVGLLAGSIGMLGRCPGIQRFEVPVERI